MKICRGCQGRLGYDCFNEYECMWINDCMERDYMEKQIRKKIQQEAEKEHEREYWKQLDLLIEEQQALAEDSWYDFKTTQ